MYILHGPAGVEGGESWIGLGTTEAARIDRLELYRILDRYFDSSELRDLCFDLGVDYEEIPGDTKAAKAREIISYLERRARLDELPGLIQEARPNVELSFGTSQARLTRRELRRWSVKLEGRGLLFLDVAAGLGRNSDWAGWLDMFVQMGFGGVIVPLLTPDLSWSKDFMLRFVEAFLKPEMTVGDALRAARNEFYKVDENPLGLLYAHYGRVDQGLMPVE
jgi:hypothetical protein